MAKFILLPAGGIFTGQRDYGRFPGASLKSRGLKVAIQKLDLTLTWIGTMSPYQHGEVFVTEDGAETDLDLGHYERFIDINISRSCNVTTGGIYSSVINKERRGIIWGHRTGYSHITNEIKSKSCVWLPSLMLMSSSLKSAAP